MLPEGDVKALARAMSLLPVAALRIDADVARALSQTGLKSIGDIVHRPRAPIAARFGAQVFARLDAMLGLAKSPISPRFEDARLCRRMARSWKASSRATTSRRRSLALAGDLCDMLARHEEGARPLAAHSLRADGAVRRIDCASSRPLREPAAIARLFREKIDAASQNGDGLDVGWDGFDLVRLAVM